MTVDEACSCQWYPGDDFHELHPYRGWEECPVHDYSDWFLGKFSTRPRSEATE
jgi:hypothetical protein